MERQKSTTTEKKSVKKTDGVIELHPNKVVEILETFLNLAKEEKLDNFIIAGFDSEDRILFSRINLNVVEQQHLVSYMQCETTIRTANEAVLTNVDHSYEVKNKKPKGARKRPDK